MLPAFPVQMNFDPTTVAEPAVQQLWDIGAGRVLMLLWRPTHLVGPGWWKLAQRMASAIAVTRPRTAEELAKVMLQHADGFEFTEHDCREFAAESIEFFCGTPVPYVIKSEAKFGC